MKTSKRQHHRLGKPNTSSILSITSGSPSFCKKKASDRGCFASHPTPQKITFPLEQAGYGTIPFISYVHNKQITLRPSVTPLRPQKQQPQNIVTGLRELNIIMERTAAVCCRLADLLPDLLPYLYPAPLHIRLGRRAPQCLFEHFRTIPHNTIPRLCNWGSSTRCISVSITDLLPTNTLCIITRVQ